MRWDGRGQSGGSRGGGHGLIQDVLRLGFLMDWVVRGKGRERNQRPSHGGESGDCIQ